MQGGKHLNRYVGMILGLLLASTVIATACGGGDKTIRTGDGNVTLSKDVPDNFPDDFPIYPDADFKGGYEGESGGVEGVVGTWETGDSLDDVSAFYDEKLADGEWISAANGSSGDGAYWNGENSDGSKIAIVTATPAGDNVSLVIIIGDNTSPSSDEDTSTTDDGSDDDTPTSSDSGNDDAELPQAVELNDGYPSDSVPLPSNARVTSSTSFNQGGAETHFIEFYSQDSAAEVADYFKDELTGNGWVESFTSNTNGELFATYARSDDADTVTNNGVVVTIRDSDVAGYVQVAISVSLVEG